MSRTISYPIIIIGMHRSGTSMIAKLLEEQGIYLGNRKQKNYEAVLFLNLNKWILRQSGGSWDQPDSIQYLLGNTKVRTLVVDYLRYMLNSPRIISYIGCYGYLRYHTLSNFPHPWAWKDPRNTYTLPLWLEIFPNAKIIHIYRHGIDVCQSLRTRMAEQLKRGEALHEKFGKDLRVYWFYTRKAGFTDSLRCAASLKDSFTLWESYMRESRAHVQTLGKHAMEIQYEKLLSEPQIELKRLFHFCGLDFPPGTITKLVRRMDRSRAYAYKRDPALLAFCEKVSHRLAKWGY